MPSGREKLSYTNEWRNPSRTWTRQLLVCRVLLALGMILPLAGETALSATGGPIEVRYRSSDSVYLSGGRVHGVEVGDRFAVLRGNEQIAEIEVVFVADHSASCRILDERQEIAAGDQVRPRQLTSQAPAEKVSGVTTLRVARQVSCLRLRPKPDLEDRSSICLLPGTLVKEIETVPGWTRIELEDGRQGWSSARYLEPTEAPIERRTQQIEALAEESLVGPGEDRQPEKDRAAGTEPGAATPDLEEAAFRGAQLPGELALDTRPVPHQVRWKERKRPAAHTSVRGTLTLDWETFTDQADGEQLNYDRQEAYLKLKVRDIGGLPYELRVRLRTQQNRRSEAGAAGSTERESRNRYYELSLIYDPPQGRYSYRVGRLSASPFVGIGYLDGVLGQMALSSIVEVGAFAGSGTNVEDFAPDALRPRYGLFARFTSPNTDSSLPWEVIVAGVREHGEEGISREFLTLQSRYSAKKWSFYQRAELDINSGWRAELTQKGTQLSNFSLTATGRFSSFARLSLSYDLFEQYRTEQTRFLPAELFSGEQRQGIRASLQFGKPRGLNLSLNGGVRDQAGESGKTVSYGFGLRHGNIASWGLSLGLNLLGFTNELSEGYTANLRAAKRLQGGHQLSLTIGDRRSQSVMFSDEAVRSTQWVRLGGWFELPMSLFANIEYEAAAGDDLEGQRLSASLGYRF